MNYTSLKIEKLKDYVLNFVENSNIQDPAHGTDHLLRVFEVGMKIGVQEKADLDVLGASLLLHDLVRPSDEKGEANHAILSAELGRKILPDIGFSDQEIDRVVNAIVKASGSGGTFEPPDTLEGKILFDADKLDGVGEIGIRRSNEMWKKRLQLEGKPFDEMLVARWYLGRITGIFNVQPGYTETSRQMGKDGIRMALEYCKGVLGDEFSLIIDKTLGDKKYFHLENYGCRSLIE
jgi:HD superfamily phosphodiesterase